MLDDKTQQLQQRLQQILQQKQQQLAAGGERLNALSPLNVLSRGYALCQEENSKLIRSASQVEVGQPITVVLEQGRLAATVTGKEDDQWKNGN